MVIRVAHAALKVPDVAATVRFYEQYLGLIQTDRVDDDIYMSCGDIHHDLILKPAPADEPSLDHVAMEVAPHTIDRVVERVIEHGAHDPRPVEEPGVAEAVIVSAPGGFDFKFVSGLQHQTRAILPKLPSPLWFSHVNLAGPDLHALGDFLEHGLGMRRSDWLGSREDPLLTWFHCDEKGALHHGIAVVQKPAPGLHHLTFDYATIQDLGDRADDYTARSGRQLVWGMGRHGGGGSAFVYFEDPAGVMVELGQGMIRCDDDARWEEPIVWSTDDPRAIDLWGSPIPERWMEKFIPVSRAIKGGAK